jgi:hypothetical protein
MSCNHQKTFHLITQLKLFATTMILLGMQNVGCTMYISSPTLTSISPSQGTPHKRLWGQNHVAPVAEEMLLQCFS